MPIVQNVRSIVNPQVTNSTKVSTAVANTFDQLRWLAAQGAMFALPRGRTKSKFETDWPNKPHTLEEAIEHAKHGGNVGLLTGKHSGGLVAVDRDIHFPETVKMFGIEADTVRVERTNAPDRGKLLYKCEGVLPKTQSWKRHKDDRHPEIEFLADGRHALIPPSEYNGGRYILTNLEAGIRPITAAMLDGLWLVVTGQFLTGEPDTAPIDLKELITDVKSAWTPESVFKHFGKVGNGTIEERGQVRILGNGGLLLKDDSWYCHADAIGGDVIGAWHYCETGHRLPKNNRQVFQDTLTAMAAAAGISIPVAKLPPKTAGSASQSTPTATTGDGDKLKISERIDRDLRKWGYNLWLNDMDESIWNGDERLTDAQRAELRMTARDDGYAKSRLLNALDDAILALAARRRRHPVRDYLSGLKWDGKDHIAHLASFFDDKHDFITYQDGTQRTVFHAFLQRWLVGSIAKMHGDESAARSNFVLVLAGDQDAGKSHFASWLCPLPDYFVEKHITPDNKDCSLQRTKAWIWEIMELGATTNRQDVESLKAHITATKVTERKPYGHFDTVRPAVSAYIGTVNPDGGGFLSDSTGNRRFAVVDIDHINWLYAERVDVNQLWAQALHLWKLEPKGYRFDQAETAVQRGNAEKHMAPDIMADMLARTFQIDATKDDWRATSSEILDALRTYAGLSHGNDKVQGRELARTLKKEWGVTSKRTNGATVYVGIRCIK